MRVDTYIYIYKCTFVFVTANKCIIFYLFLLSFFVLLLDDTICYYLDNCKISLIII